jgi:hypothetical protein
MPCTVLGYLFVYGLYSSLLIINGSSCGVRTAQERDAEMTQSTPRLCWMESWALRARRVVYQAWYRVS